MIQRILKNKNKKAKALLVVLFLVFSFSFFNVNNAKAICEDGISEKSCECFNGSTSLQLFPAGQNISDFNSELTDGFCSQESCMQYCKYKFPSTTSVKYDGGTLGKSSIQNSSSAVVPAPTVKEAVGGIFVDGVKWILSKVLELVGWIFAIAATLFAWVVDPVNVSGDNGMLNKQAVKDVWIMVRDLLNMGFIMVLLFAAFGTIFQVDRLNLKKVWLNILINALLVNFSYPIARFIIDISNVTFYYLLNNLFVANGSVGVSGSSVFAGFSSSSQLANMLVPSDYASHDIAYLIASIVVVFIFGMTLLIIAALFVVRLVALTMLVMFSPIGFVGYILPDTRKYASDWWTQLLNYSFFAPIMIFGMAIALRIMTAMESENFQSFVAKASPNSPADQANFIASAAFFVIPIIILWSTIGIAKKFGIEGASAVTGKVTKWGKKIANIPWGGAKMGWNATGIPGGFKQTKDYYSKRGIKLPGFKNRHFGSDQTEGTNSWVAQNIGRVPNAYNNNVLKKIGESAKDNNMEDMTKDQLNTLVARGTEYERIAAVEQLAKNGDITKKQFDEFIGKLGEDSQLGKRLIGKIKEKSPQIALGYIKNDDPEKQKAQREKYAKGFKMENLNNDILEHEEFTKLLISTGKMDKKAIDGLTSKERETYKNTVNSIVNNLGSSATDMSDPVAKNTQIQRLALTGFVHSSVATKGLAEHDNARKVIWNKLNKESASNLKSATIDQYYEEIAENVNSGNFVEIIKSIPDDVLKQELIGKIMSHTFAAGSNGDKLKKHIKRDVYLRMFS